MKLWVIIRQSVKAIFANKGRSSLTILGIVIGIAAVIALIGLGQGAKNSINDKISGLGSNNLTVAPGGGVLTGGRQSGTSGSLTVSDLTSLQDAHKHPLLSSVTGVIAGSEILGAADDQRRYAVDGTTANYFAINKLAVSQGALWTQADVSGASSMLVAGSEAASDLGLHPDSTLQLGATTFSVEGVLASADSNGFSDPNDQLYIPYTSAEKLFGSSSFSSFTIQVKNSNDVDAAQRDVQNTLLKNHGISNAKLADFSVISSKDLLSTIDQVTTLLTSLLAGIAAISLLVGGIGIMNIMLVSVTERTREIGLRKAVGAKTRDILLQFVVEAVVLTLLGGAIGIAVGYAMALAAGKKIGLTADITSSAILLAVGVSSAIGLIFGLYPAARASRLNPIDALRYE